MYAAAKGAAQLLGIGTSGAMFNLTSGSVTKEYDGATDRLRIKANGTMTLEPMSLSVSTMSINSKDYVLPINSSITIELEGGTVTAKLSRAEFYEMQSREYVESAFDGSLPAFVAAFSRGRKLSPGEIEALQKFIDESRG